MDGPAEKGKEEEVLVIAGDANGATPGTGKRPARRCIQKKLVFGGSPGGQHDLEEENEDDETDDERRKKKKGKARSRAVATKKASHGGKDASGLSKASDFFTKVSVKRTQHKEEKFDLEPASGEHDSKETFQSSNGKKNCKKLKSCSEDFAPETAGTCSIVPNLWLEAENAAKENQRLFTGKQIHPFFSCRKTTRRTSSTPENYNSQSKYGTVFLPPIHVADTQQVNYDVLDWSNWVFKQKSLFGMSSIHSSESPQQSIFKDAVPSLRLDDVSTVPEGVLMDQLLNERCVNSDVDLCTRVNISFDSPYESQEIRFPERLPCQHTCENVVDYSLWTNKYQPEKASKVCGNNEAVSFVNEWLKSWHEKRTTIDVSDNSSQSDSDIDIENEERLANVLLVTGPVGCGKSAAIYACAKEQGFEVIEVNASDHRNGALIRQKFGEATESHGLNIRSIKDLSPGKNSCLELNQAAFDNGEEKGVEDDDLVVVLETCTQDSGNTTDNKATVCQLTNKSLILFDDVDTVFDEDRGFIGTILQLAETSKQPIILTSNCKYPLLPQCLNRKVIEFSLPSQEELLSCVKVICNAEGIPVSSLLLRRFIKLCQADIRKTIMHLQFWCQGKIDEPGRNKQCTYRPFELDLDAAHLAMPAVVPWGFSCELSEKVALEVCKVKNTFLEENISVVNAVKKREQKSIEDDNAVSIEGNGPVNSVNDGIATMLAVVKWNESSFPFKDRTALPDILESPLKFASRTVQHRSNTVLYSESEDEQDYEIPTVDIDLNNECLSPDISVVPFSQTIECDDNHQDMSLFLMAKQSADCDSHPRQLCSFDLASPLEIFGTSESLNASCIPESNLVPETENFEPDILSTAISSGCLYTVSNINLLNNFKSLNDLPDSDDGSLGNNDLDVNMYTLENTCVLHEESVHGNEEPRDMVSGCARFLNREYQLMDECSRADFGISFLSKEVCKNYKLIDPVQETWQRLRGCSEDLNSLITTDLRGTCQMLKYSYGMTSLISDTDVMLSGCETLIQEYTETLSTSCDETETVSWCDERLEMASAFAQHSLCFFEKKSKVLGLEMCREKPASLGREMLAFSSNIMVLGKLLSQESPANDNLSDEKKPFRGLTSCDISLIRAVESRIYAAILPIIPQRLSTVIRGQALHEYSSFLSQISRVENSRLSDGIKKQQRRRVRASPHYLKSCPLALSSEDVLSLAQHCCFGGVGFG